MNEQDGIERSGQSDQLREIGFSMSVFSLTCFDLDHDPVSFIYPDFCSNFHLSVCCVLHFFFSFLSFLKSVVWLTTIWQLILCLSHWLCISVSVSFVWSHFPKLLGISSVSSHYTCSRFCRYIFLFFIHFHFPSRFHVSSIFARSAQCFFLLKSISFVAVTDINYPRILKAGLPFGWAFNIETVIVVVDSFNRHNLLSH